MTTTKVTKAFGNKKTEVKKYTVLAAIKY